MDLCFDSTSDLEDRSVRKILKDAISKDKKNHFIVLEWWFDKNSDCAIKYFRLMNGCCWLISSTYQLINISFKRNECSTHEKYTTKQCVLFCTKQQYKMVVDYLHSQRYRYVDCKNIIKSWFYYIKDYYKDKRYIKFNGNVMTANQFICFVLEIGGMPPYLSKNYVNSLVYEHINNHTIGPFELKHLMKNIKDSNESDGDK